VATNTLALLRTASKEEADKENDPHIGDTEWNRRINDGYRSLWNLVRSENEDFFLEKVAATCASASNNVLSVTLGNNRLRALWYLSGSTPDDYEIVRRGNLRQRACDREYIIASGTIYIWPSTLAVGSYSVWREPVFTELANDASAIHADLVEWAEYIYLYAAHSAKGKEEADPNDIAGRLGRLEREILALTKDRDSGEAARVVDVRPREYYRPPNLPRL
jgi:hypothetical protein